ncbi:hypothetical protein BJV77DRAFT_965115 [Russula vinacea]|nr:hypothetical protein BJV77DRAFT_965115 [Russula vinacea]
MALRLTAPLLHTAPLQHIALTAPCQPPRLQTLYMIERRASTRRSLSSAAADVPNDSEHWRASPYFAFVNSHTELCASIAENTGHVIEGFVHLHREAVGSSVIRTQRCRPYLKNNLHWGVQALPEYQLNGQGSCMSESHWHDHLQMNACCLVLTVHPRLVIRGIIRLSWTSSYYLIIFPPTSTPQYPVPYFFVVPTRSVVKAQTFGDDYRDLQVERILRVPHIRAHIP